MKNFQFRFRDNTTGKVEEIHNFRDKGITACQFDPENYSAELYIGMLDRTGQMIFENDVVVCEKTSFSDDGNLVTTAGIVKFLSPAFVLYHPSVGSRLNFSEPLPMISSNIKIICDISNPNLGDILKNNS